MKLTKAYTVLLLLALVVCSCGVQAQKFCECIQEKCTNSSCYVSFPFGERLEKVLVTPGFYDLLKEDYHISQLKGDHRILVYVAIFEGEGFVYDVRCKGIEDSADEWRLRKLLSRLKFKIPDDYKNSPELYKGIISFWITRVPRR